MAVDCALAFEPVAFEAGKSLQYEIAEGIQVLGDGDKLRQLVSVLLDNAIKYGASFGAITVAFFLFVPRGLMSLKSFMDCAGSLPSRSRISTNLRYSFASRMICSISSG